MRIADRLCPSRAAVLTLCVIVTVTGTPLAAQIDVEAIATGAEPAVYHLITERGNGTAFLVNRDEGLLVTNAHVTSGQRDVTIRLDSAYKVAGVVVVEDRRRDIAVVQVNPEAVADRAPLRLDPRATGLLRIGDPVVVMGYPLSRGVVTTAGIVSSRSGGDLVMTDARVSPGNSGGPVFNREGAVVGVVTFLAANSTGTGLGGAIPAATAEAAVDRARSTVGGEPPGADSLPMMPRDHFPIEVLEQAATAQNWPVDLYDITATGVGGGLDVRVFTPPLLIRIGGLATEDLRYWALEAGEYPPVVIVRIHPQVGQSREGAVANFFLAVLAGATGTYFDPIYDPESKGNFGEISVRKGSELVPTIQRKRARTVLAGAPIEVVHLVLSADLFRPEPDGSWDPVLINIDDPETGLRAWVIADDTLEQVYRDFEVYLSRDDPD